LYLRRALIYLMNWFWSSALLIMLSKEEKVEQLSQITRQIIDQWYERVKENYVTEDDTRELGVEPEIKLFHELKNHRVKFLRIGELDVTYGLGVDLREEFLLIESSVNNKSRGFDYEVFTNKLKSHYWRSQNEKPWTEPNFDRFTYNDFLFFEPIMGQSLILEKQKDKADIIRLLFQMNPSHEGLLLQNIDVLEDLIEGYCLAPLRRIYAESYREG